jgi:hypothetical protein
MTNKPATSLLNVGNPLPDSVTKLASYDSRKYNNNGDGMYP